MRLWMIFDANFDDLEGKDLIWTTASRFQAFSRSGFDATCDDLEGKELIWTTVSRL